MGSSKKQTVGYEYYAGMHIVACHGPVDRVRRLIVGERTAWKGAQTDTGQVFVDAANLFGGRQREGGVRGPVDVEFGKADQGRNSYLQAQLGADVPAHRGVLGLVLRKVLVSMMNPYVKPWTIEAQRVHVAEGGAAQWYDAKAGISSASTLDVGKWVDLGDGRGPVQDGGGALTYSFKYSGSPTTFTRTSFEGALDLIRTTYGSQWQLVGYYTSEQPRMNLFGEEHAPQGFDDPDGGPQYVYLCFASEQPAAVKWRGDTPDAGISMFCDTLLADGVPSPPENGSVGAYLYSNVRRAPPSGDDQIDWSNYGHGGLLRLIDYDTSPLPAGYDAPIAGQTLNNCIFYPADAGGHSPIAVLQTFKIVRVERVADDPYVDMNPAHIVRECLTNSEWGLGYADADIGASFTAAADTLYTEGFGLSLLWEQESSIYDFIALILRHIDAVCYVDPATGLFELKLIRGDYVVGLLPHFTAGEIVSVESFVRPTPAEMVNTVTIRWVDRENHAQATTVHDVAGIEATGQQIASTIALPGIPTPELAQKVAMRELGQVSRPIAKATIIFTRAASGVRIGDAIRVTLPELQLSQAVMRVQGISYGTMADGRIRMELVEDAFALPAFAQVSIAASAWTSPHTTPVPAPSRVLLEAPYWVVAREIVGESETAAAELDAEGGFLLAGIRAASADTVNFDAWVRPGGTGDFVERGTGDPTPTGLLQAAIDQAATSIALTSATRLEAVEVDGWAVLEPGTANEEIVAVKAIDADAATVTIARGVLDTTPHAHAAGARIWFLDAGRFTGEDQYLDGETLEVRCTPTTSRGTLGVAAAPTDAIVFASRQARPYPPGNVTIEGVAYPVTVTAPFTVAWAHRDRLQQTAYLVEQSEASIGPEAGVTYALYVYNDDDDTLLYSTAGLTGVSHDPPVSALANLRVELAAERNGIESWQRQVRTFAYVYGALLDEAADPLTTEAAEYLLLDQTLPPTVTTWTIQAAAPVRTGNRQVIYFAWEGYPTDPQWSPSPMPANFKIIIRKRGATVGAVDAYYFEANVNLYAGQANPQDYVNGCLAGSIAGGVGTDKSVTQAALDAGLPAGKVYGWAKTATPYPSDWSSDFGDVAAGFEHAIAFPPGEFATFKLHPTDFSQVPLGGWEVSFYPDEQTMPHVTVKKGSYDVHWEDAVAVARPQISGATFVGPIAPGMTYRVTLSGVDFDTVAAGADTATTLSGKIAAAIDAHASYSAVASIDAGGFRVTVTGTGGTTYTCAASVF